MTRRCCLASIRDYLVVRAERRNDGEGDVLWCKYCHAPITFKDGEWRSPQANAGCPSSTVCRVSP